MLTWLASMVTRQAPSPARHPREGAPAVTRVPAWRDAGRADGDPGAPPEAVTQANANASLETLKLHLTDTLPPTGDPGR
jgi:hypothetical protein